MFNYYKKLHLSRLKFIFLMSLICVTNFLLIQPTIAPLHPAISFPINVIFLLAAILLMCARYHDIGKSGFYLLLLLIPIFGPIIVVVQLTFFKTKQYENRYIINHEYMKVK